MGAWQWANKLKGGKKSWAQHTPVVNRKILSQESGEKEKSKKDKNLSD